MMRVMILLAVLSSPILAADAPATAPVKTKAPEAVAEAKKPTFIVHFTTGPSWVEGKPFGEQKHAREHSANLQRLRASGSILMGARYADVGMVILRADSEADARGEIDQDPAVQGGTFK